VHQGQKLVFTLRDGNGSRDDLKLTLEEQIQAWAGQQPGFGLYFNCASRGRGLYGFPDLDTSYIKQYLGEVPLIGFFTGCEIGPMQQQSSLHLYSGVLVLVGEKVMH
jgi:small ligand-binding sensory domain FIST